MKPLGKIDLPNQIQILGFNGDMLSILFEGLKSLGFTGEINIIPNIGICDNVRFENGLQYKISSINDEFNISGESCLFSVSSPMAKIAVFEDFKQKHKIDKDNYISFIDPSVNLAKSVIIGKGTTIQAGATLSTFTEIGFGVTISRNTSIGHHNILKDFVRINPGVNIGGHCSVGYGTTIGIGSTVFDSISIGKNCIIGGGSVVTRDVPDDVVAYGNPCKVIRANTFEK